MPARTLTLSPNLKLPIEAVTETFGIIAKRGAGKTYTAKVLAEELERVGASFVIIDPVGVWWGLRAGADGDPAGGIPIIILGGDHADAPLEHTAGATVAGFIIDNDINAILDLSHLRKNEARTFVTAFAEELYRRNREPRHLLIDEADAFAPQRAMAEAARCLGAIEDLVRRGRARGIGVTLVTQRAAVINKNVLTQVEVLIALRTTSPQDRAAIDAWVEVHAGDANYSEVAASLPSLAIGEAWVWSPGWLGILSRVRIRTAKTFDSSSTPKAGERRRAPKRLADVDLGALTAAMADTIEKAKADNPAHLRRRIVELERALAKPQPAPPAPERIVETIEVPILDAALVDKLEAMLTPAVALLGELQELALKGRMALERAVPRNTAQKTAATTPIRRELLEQPAPRPADLAPEGTRLKAGARRMLTELAHWPNGLTATQLSTRAKVKRSGGSWSTYLSALRVAGLIEDGGLGFVITDAGRDYIGIPETGPMTPAELRADWLGRLKAGARRMLMVLVDQYPDTVARDQLSELAGVSTDGGSWSTYLSVLRTNDLITEPTRGEYRAADTLIG